MEFLAYPGVAIIVFGWVLFLLQAHTSGATVKLLKALIITNLIGLTLLVATFLTFLASHWQIGPS